MIEDTERTVVCPSCGAADVENRGVVVACQPYERPASLRAFRRAIERKYRCADCETEFSEIEHIRD